MKSFLRIVKLWLAVCFVLAFFVVPLHLIAIYPEVPDTYYRVIRLFGYGAIKAPATELGFWYRITGCGVSVLIGMLLARRWLLDLVEEHRNSQSQAPLPKSTGHTQPRNP